MFTKICTTQWRHFSVFFFSMLICSLAIAQNVAVVNGTPIRQIVFDQNIKAAMSQGQKDTPEFRQSLKEELINREVLAQESSRLGLDKSEDAKLQWNQIRENFLVELLLVDYSKKNPITDEEIRADYDRQVAALGGAGATQQYKLSVIVVPTSNEANEIIGRLKKGDSFEKLAKDKSIDATKSQGGLVGWVLPNQVSPVISAAMVNLGKSSYSASALQGPNGWMVIKVDDKRPFKVPTFSESKDRIRAGLVQQQRVELVKKLRAAAKVTE